MTIITYFLILNNIIGFVQVALHPKADDSFIGFYGMHGIGMHALSLINFLMAAYFFFHYQQNSGKKYAFLFLFFLFSGVACFYGLGLIILMFSVFFYRFTYKKLVLSILIFALCLGSLGGILYIVKPVTFNYNVENIQKVQLFFKKDLDKRLVPLIPRKLLLFKNYFTVYSNDIGLFLFGTGPGTFNSRSSFLLNGDYSKSGFFEAALGTHTPALAKKYIYTLWNSKNAKFKDFTDGTRNEPFSSVIAMLSEYGFIITSILSFIIFHYQPTKIRGLRFS